MNLKPGIISWNYRGARSCEFHRSIKELIRMHKPTLILILEPRISGSEKYDVCLRLGKSDWARSEAMGFSRGVCIIWNKEEFKLQTMHVSRYFIHSRVHRLGLETWDFTAIYASLDARKRGQILEDLGTFQVNGPWMAIKDFNCTMEDRERATKGGISTRFIKWINDMGMIDLGFTGPKYTWNHRQSMTTRRSTRLDRVVCNKA